MQVDSSQNIMKSKIIFHDLKMEILVETGIIARYYGELMYVIYDAPYCWLHFTGKNRYRVVVTMKKLMDNLPNASFFRCKRSTIFNVCYYKEYVMAKSMVVMEDGREFKLTRRNILNFNAMRNDISRISPPCTTCYTCTNKKCESRVTFCRQK